MNFRLDEGAFIPTITDLEPDSGTGPSLRIVPPIADPSADSGTFRWELIEVLFNESDVALIGEIPLPLPPALVPRTVVRVIPRITLPPIGSSWGRRVEVRRGPCLNHLNLGVRAVENVLLHLLA